MGHTMKEISDEKDDIQKEDLIPFLPLSEKQKSKKHGDSCVLVVGTTGTGKTSTVNIYTGSSLEVGEGAQAVTVNTIAVEDEIHADAPKWIDSPGWSDTEGRSDAKVFKELLRHMQNNKLSKVKAVVWCVLPQPRMDSTLQAQAKFIDMLTVENDKGRIWSNVVIICKGKLAKTAYEDCQGARMAANKVYVHAEPKCLGYEFVTDEVLEGTSEKLRKESLRALTKDEIRIELEKIFNDLPPLVQVVFSNQKCQACGQTGDPRLMEDKCHRNKKEGHVGTLEQRFSKAEVGVAAAGGVAGVIGLSVAAVLAPEVELILLALPVIMGPGAIMSGHRFLNSSTTSQPPCGMIKITDMRWSCCGAQELSPGGCTDLCDLCGAVWGKDPPCVLIRHPDSNLQQSLAGYEVHVKNHDLVDISEEYKT
eukprot:GFUD01004406.1.p1 GENE.GFUD01004406.1~~GFUD01004406.1.p1  ORF type:complete len:421 (+),score=91.63 GFUD01004406.1:429-1691(+)